MIGSKTMMVLVTSFILMIAFTAVAPARDIPRIGIDELRAELGNSDVIVLDVRAAPDWESSQTKIAGAVRADPSKLDSWIDQHSKDKKIVLYCA